MASIHPPAAEGAIAAIVSASLSLSDDEELARDVCATITECGAGPDGVATCDVLPRAPRLRRGVTDATVAFLRDVSRADAAGELTMPTYVALTRRLRAEQAEAATAALASVLPPPLRRR